MCTHELWTYPECGCAFDHYIPCWDADCNSLAANDNSKAIRKASRASQLSRTYLEQLDSEADSPSSTLPPPQLLKPKLTPFPQITTSAIERPLSQSLTPSPQESSSDSESPVEDYYHNQLRSQHALLPRSFPSRKGSIITLQSCNFDLERRQCSVSRTTQKTFLEPICDDCLLEEMGVKRYSGMLPTVDGVNEDQSDEITESVGRMDGENEDQEQHQEQVRGRTPVRDGEYHAKGHTRNNTGLIWSSDVQIEITPSPESADGAGVVHDSPCPDSFVSKSPIAPSPTSRKPLSNEIRPYELNGRHNSVPPIAMALDARRVSLRAESKCNTTFGTQPAEKNLLGAQTVHRRATSHNADVRNSITHKPAVKSPSDVSRRRPWLVKELEDYLNQGTGKVIVEENEKCKHDGIDVAGSEDVTVDGVLNEKKEILESTVEVEVFDESYLNGTSPVLVPYCRGPFPSSQYPRTTSVSIDDPQGSRNVSSPPTRQSSAISTLTTLTTTDADADDESSLRTCTPLANQPVADDSDISQSLTRTLSPNVTTTRGGVNGNRKAIPRPRLRLRSETKILRRRGMDITRSSFALRISSRWGSGERECMEGFKDDLLGKAQIALKEEREGDMRAVVRDIAKSGRSGDGYSVGGGMMEIDDGVSGGGSRSVNHAGDAVEGQEWSQQLIKSLEEVRPGSTDNGDETKDSEEAAEPPSIKLHRNDRVILGSVVAPNDATGSANRGRKRDRSPAKNLLTRFAAAQHGGRSWAKGVLGDLKRSLSRDSRGRRGRNNDCGDGGSHGIPSNEVMRTLRKAGSLGDGIRTLRAVADSSDNLDIVPDKSKDATLRRGSRHTLTSNSASESIKAGSESANHLYLHPATSNSAQPASEDESWQAHLSHDLLMPRKSKKHILRNAMLSKSDFQLSTTVPRNAVDSSDILKKTIGSSGTKKALGGSWASRSSPILLSRESRFYNDNCKSAELTRRLLSTSTGPSVPMTASAMTSDTWTNSEPGEPSTPVSGNWKGKRIASIVSSSEFDEEDELVGNPWTNAADEVVGNIKNVAIVDTRYQHADSIDAVVVEDSDENLPSDKRPRNPTPSSAPQFRFKPRQTVQPISPSNAKSILTQHPLSTPLRIPTPSRPILSARTSSLSSPPMQTPTRVSIPAAYDFTFEAATTMPENSVSAPPLSDSDKTGTAGGMLTHSPTSGFACVWKRYPCAGGCGRFVGEEVSSCICASQAVGKGGVGTRKADSHAKEGALMCRSTAPIVQYVDGYDQQVGKCALCEQACGCR